MTKYKHKKISRLIWRLSVAAVFILIVLTLSPLVTAAGKTEPFFMGMPFTLWLSILLTILLVVLTYVGGIVMPNDKEDEQ